MVGCAGSYISHSYSSYRNIVMVTTFDLVSDLYIFTTQLSDILLLLLLLVLVLVLIFVLVLVVVLV